MKSKRTGTLIKDNFSPVCSILIFWGEEGRKNFLFLVKKRRKTNVIYV